MTKFMVLYLSSIPARAQMAQATPEQMQAGMAEWMKWKEKAGSAVVDFGSPLASGKHIESGRISSGQLTITGYSIVKANSLEEAVALFKDHPHFKTPGGASVEILEFMTLPGM